MARIKKRSPKKVEGKSKGVRQSREDAEIAAQERIKQRVIQLPNFRQTLSLSCKFQGKPKIVSLDYQAYVHQFPKHQNLIHQLQVAIEIWASETKSSKTAEANFYAQQLLLEFLSKKNNEKVTGNIASLTAPVLRRFLKYLQDKYPSEGTVRKYFTGITSALRAIYKSSFSELPEIGVFLGKFPVPPREKSGKDRIPPLDHRSFNDLVLALQSHFDLIKKIPGKRSDLLKDGRPTLDQMNSYQPWAVLPNALWYYHHVCLKAPTKSAENYRLQRLKKEGWSIEEIKEHYSKEWERVKDTAFDPRSNPYIFNIEDRKNDQERTLSLVLKEWQDKYSDYPLQWELDDSTDFLRSTGHIGEDARYKNHQAQELYQYVLHLRHPLFQNKFNGISVLLFYLYPTVASVSVCLYLLKVQTGWNLTVLLGLEFEGDFEDMFQPCPISQDYVLLVGEKVRGRVEEKYHRSKKNNKYGAYRILKFLWGFGKDIRVHTGSKSPWAYLKLVFKQGESIANNLEQFTHHSYSKDLCREGLIHDNNGNPLKGFAFESIRKSLAEIEDEVSEYDIQKLSSMLQNSPDVAATHYRDEKKTIERLRSVQESWVHHFTYFQGSFNQTLKQSSPSDHLSLLSEAEQDNGSHIQVITTDGITPVSICKNPYSPDWHGHKTSVGDGERCSFFHGCSNCSQCVVFTETLPFIHKRLQIISQLRGKMNIGDWESAYHIEWYAWKEVLEYWPSQEDVVHAKALSAAVKLPVRPQLYGV